VAASSSQSLENEERLGGGGAGIRRWGVEIYTYSSLYMGAEKQLEFILRIKA